MVNELRKHGAIKVGKDFALPEGHAYLVEDVQTHTQYMVTCQPVKEIKVGNDEITFDGVMKEWGMEG